MQLSKKPHNHQVWTIVWFDGIDFWWKTSLATKLVEILAAQWIQATLLKCSPENLWKNKERYEGHKKLIASTEQWIVTKCMTKRAYMLHYLHAIELPQLEKAKELKAKWQVVILDRSIVSFVVNRGRDIWLNEKDIDWFRQYLSEKEWMLTPDIYVHVTADEDMLLERATTPDDWEISLVDEATLTNIPETLARYQTFYSGELATCLKTSPIVTIDTSNIRHMRKEPIDHKLDELILFIKNSLSKS